MKAEHIRAIIAKRPFEPLEFQLESGEKYVLRHPEQAFVRDVIIMLELDGNIHLFDPDAVTALSRKKRNAKTSGRKR